MKQKVKIKVITYPSDCSEVITYFYDNEFEDLVKTAVEIEMLNLGLIGRFFPGFKKRLKERVSKNICKTLEVEL